MKLYKNQRGFSHHFLVPIIVVLAITGIGVYLLRYSRAADLSSKALRPVCIGHVAGKAASTSTKRCTRLFGKAASTLSICATQTGHRRFCEAGDTFIELNGWNYIPENLTNSGFDSNYDPDAAEAMLSRLEHPRLTDDKRYNIVRVHMSSAIGGASSNPSLTLDPLQLNNFRDFVSRAASHGIYVYVYTTYPSSSGWQNILTSCNNDPDYKYIDFSGRYATWLYTKCSREAFAKYLDTLTLAIKNDPLYTDDMKRAIVVNVLNEPRVSTNLGPWSFTSGNITLFKTSSNPSGITYNLADNTQRDDMLNRAMYEFGKAACEPIHTNLGPWGGLCATDTNLPRNKGFCSNWNGVHPSGSGVEYPANLDKVMTAYGSAPYDFVGVHSYLIPSLCGVNTVSDLVHDTGLSNYHYAVLVGEYGRAESGATCTSSPSSPHQAHDWQTQTIRDLGAGGVIGWQWYTYGGVPDKPKPGSPVNPESGVRWTISGQDCSYIVAAALADNYDFPD